MTKRPSPPSAFEVPGQLGALLNAGGHLHAQLVVTRTDGRPLSADDRKDVDATLAVWTLRERKVNDVIKQAAKLAPASKTPSSRLVAAVAERGGLRPGASAAKPAKAR